MKYPKNNTIIGVHHKLNGTKIDIKFENIYNLYNVYIVEKKNNLVVDVCNVNPEKVCYLFYKWFLENIVDINDVDKKGLFIHYINNYLKKKFPKINESNWRVEALKLRD
tara:strand:- start:1992 stop:2318 length:327 start_codon:yes stop_codon:yes gene_type:complete